MLELIWTKLDKLPFVRSSNLEVSDKATIGFQSEILRLSAIEPETQDCFLGCLPLWVSELLA